MDIIDETDDFMDEWYRNRRRITILVLILAIRQSHNSGRGNYVDRVIRTGEELRERERTRNELMHKIRTDKSSYNIIRMTPQAFEKFCKILRASGHVTDTRKATLEEQVAKFLYILGHNMKNRSISFFFNRSSETTSRHFHRVLKAVVLLENQFLVQHKGIDVPPEIQNNNRFPYFKDCIGALDGIHVRVRASNTDAARYRGRKEHPTQNVLAVGTFDLRFTYVLPGWEGTASDSRIIKDAFTREDKLNVPPGKYFLVDAGYMLTGILLAPYRGVRYHLKEYSKRGPENARELFNHRHSSLRIAIERAFGVLKIRFPIIGDSRSTYSIETQTEIILACCILHNFLMGVDPYQELLAEADRRIQQRNYQPRHEVQDNNDEDTRRAALMRDNIATAMWNNYVLRL